MSYLASAAGVAGARRPEPVPPRSDEKTSILAGLRAIAVNPWLRALTAHAAIYNGAAQILVVNLVVYAVTDRGLGPGLFGLALSAAGAGAFLGTLASLQLAGRLGYGRTFGGALTLSTGTPLLIALLPGTGSALAATLALVQLISGFGLGVANVLSVTLRQVVIPAATSPAATADTGCSPSACCRWAARSAGCSGRPSAAGSGWRSAQPAWRCRRSPCSTAGSARCAAPTRRSRPSPTGRCHPPAG
ncbi:MFS transporter [Micromonospora soli]|uniref:MFS transporter n=1 Tax=Micromonospora sp. NBRC 110009 TaxID=3061627 RepID=UPI00267229F8|nr:MFS transporter [Micromonospora sp. NBRC 110009]WKT99049.1 MFS transporter [Micromonospora sp. NBRC 110009]